MRLPRRCAAVLFPICAIALLPASASATSAPLCRVSFQLVDNRIFLPVTLNGEGPFQMMFDTGGGNLLHPEVVRRLALTSRPEGRISGTGGDTIESGSTHLREIRAGCVSISDQRADVVENLDGPNVFGRSPYDGLIGREFLDRYVVRIDYQKRELTFYAPASFEYDGNGEILPLLGGYPLPAVQGSIDGAVARLGLDTGARTSIIIYSGFIDRNRMRIRYKPRFEGITGWGLGGPIRSQVVRISEVRLGAARIARPVARLTTMKSGLTVQDDMAGIIGPDILKRFITWIDQARSRVIFERSDGFDSPEAYDRSGMWIGQGGGFFLVMDVMPGGPADRAGLRAGDHLVEVGGRPAKELLLPDARSMFKELPARARIGLTIVRHGRRIEKQ